MSRVVTNLQEAAAFTFQDQSKQAFTPKPTFAALSEAMTEAVNSIKDDQFDPLMRVAFVKLRDQLFLSPRLSQWQSGADEKGNRGYWLKSQDQTATVTVREDKVVLSTPDRDHPKYPFNYDVITDELAATTLFKSIQDAQAIVQPGLNRMNGMALDTESGDEFFEENDPEYIESAGLDAALEETHPEPLVEDDAELIEEVCNADEDGEQNRIRETETDSSGSFTAKANRKNAVTDGVICSHCGNLNQDAYKGVCPKCPVAGRVVQSSATKQPPKPWPAPPEPKAGKGRVSDEWVLSRLKSLQGRVLTVLDASPIADKVQRDAVKSLINKEFRREMDKVSGETWRDDDPRFPRE